MSHPLTPVTDVVTAHENGQKVLLVSGGGQRMPVDLVISADEAKVELLLRNGSVKTFRANATTHAVIKGVAKGTVSQQASGKTLADRKKADKAARDRELRQRMKGTKLSKS